MLVLKFVMTKTLIRIELGDPDEKMDEYIRLVVKLSSDDEGWEQGHRIIIIKHDQA